MPILQGFPDFETVKFFTGKFFQKYNFTPVFYDIETTGLSRNSTYLYLIGAVGIEDETWNFYQWMAENASEEETILRIFSQFLQQYNLMISYNGERFDQPYLEARYEKYGIPSPFTGKQSLDLYLTLKPLKSLLKLSVMKQPCMEEFLGIKDRIYDNGSQMQQALEKANERYETLMTAPRRDMGDSIQKAFSNAAESLLKDMNLENSAANQRAVRILGYNGIDIYEENIQNVKTLDEQMQRAFKNMTPAVTLEMIRRGENPLDMSMEQLNQVAEDIKPVSYTHLTLPTTERV